MQKTVLSMTLDTRITITSHIGFILAILEQERENANTHSQRNAYQHVIRCELEALTMRVSTSSDAQEINSSDSIPF